MGEREINIDSRKRGNETKLNWKYIYEREIEKDTNADGSADAYDGSGKTKCAMQQKSARIRERLDLIRL